MSDPACKYPGLRDPAFDLHGITRGSRLVSWLMRRSNCIWTDKCTGRLLLRVARAAGLRVHAASPGPLLARSGRRVPLPSWFVVPCDEAAPWTLSDAINNALEADPAAGTSPHIAKLMERVLDTHALDPKHRTPRCPPALLEPPRAPRVLLIDERLRSALGGAPARTRRKTFERMIESARTAHPGAQFWIAHSGECGTGPWMSSLVHTLPRGTQCVGEKYSLCAPHCAASITSIR